MPTLSSPTLCNLVWDGSSFSFEGIWAFWRVKQSGCKCLSLTLGHWPIQLGGNISVLPPRLLKCQVSRDHSRLFPADSIWWWLYLPHGLVTLTRPWAWEWLHQEEPCWSTLEIFVGMCPWCLKKETYPETLRPCSTSGRGNGNQGDQMLHVSIYVERSLSDFWSGKGILCLYLYLLCSF